MPSDTPSPPPPTDGESSLEWQMTHLGRRLLVPLGLALIALVGLAMYADASQVLVQLRAFERSLLPAILGLSLVNYTLRFGRWSLYLKRLDLELPLWHSLLIFLVGFPLSITPGKLGELGKAWLVRALGGGPARRAVAVVLAERLMDLLGVFVLACLGSLAFPGMALVAWVGLGLMIVAIGLLAWPAFVNRLVALLGRIRFLAGRVTILVEIQDHLRALLTPGLLLTGLAVSIVAWGAEGLGFALVVSSYAPDASWLAGVFNYSLASLAGGLAMLPGGLIATEGVLTALLGSQGLSASAAASATIIVRVATLWFAVGLGLAAIPFLLAALRGRPKNADHSAGGG